MTSVVRLVDCAEAAAPLPELEAVAGRGLAAVQGTRVLHRNLIQVKVQDPLIRYQGRGCSVLKLHIG